MVSVGKRKVIRRKAGKSTNGMGLDTDPYEGIDIQGTSIRNQIVHLKNIFERYA